MKITFAPNLDFEIIRSLYGRMTSPLALDFLFFSFGKQIDIQQMML